ncbi:unnamed protein product [Mycena citricolor]|uniref:FAD/NAD(P)-binding domain-containing protein n=1 Tax=Mycena citricolor TaxID=2018698 RepID=A0AAD2K2U5_9AGAR|nr:unnamed protein product [Mycena citricolor]
MILSVLSSVVLISLAGTHVAASTRDQFPFVTETQEDFYEFKWPIRRVAVIGAGVSGLIAYRELTEAGFDTVKIFERDEIPGGVWHYTDELPDDAPIPNLDPVVGDFEPSFPPQGMSLPYEQFHFDDAKERFRKHRAPHAVWKSLTSNVPASMMHFTGLPFTPETSFHIPQQTLCRYIRSAYSYYGINSNDRNENASYSTRVELVDKRYDAEGNERGWTLTLKKLTTLGPLLSREEWWTEDFDAVVVATGTFNAPHIPNIPGLAEWKIRFPQTISHSREYRSPEKFANSSVLVVGAGPSATGVSADLQSSVAANYLSLRVGLSLPRFVHVSDLSITAERQVGNALQFLQLLKDGYHNSSWQEDGTSVRPLITDGTHYRSLYRDFLYIEEPTLGFVNMNLGIVTWTHGDYTALALAKIWSGKARLPSQDLMWQDHYRELTKRGGYSKQFPLLGAPHHSSYIAFYSGWLNSAAAEFGGKMIDGMPKDFIPAIISWQRDLFYNTNPVQIPPDFPTALLDEPVDVLHWMTGRY